MLRNSGWAGPIHSISVPPGPTPMAFDHRPPHADPEPGAKKILEALRGLRFGSVEITVHEGRIVQIERKEKFRLNLACPEASEPEVLEARRS
ncbi:YezD family protein [Methylomagnum ishizawai]|uniref:YezD family protein n=1 Tax=Methylomagnum ishizawai TaxID=1760988 RepID=UPI001C331816|nr:hypothetical protein MishRS11D_38540 [Methylomagnum ishizawai]